jgi:streptogramin lyase
MRDAYRPISARAPPPVTSHQRPTTNHQRHHLVRKPTAEVIREYGPFQGTSNVAGVTYDGQSVWFAAGSSIRAFDPDTGEDRGSLDVPAHAGSAFDGEFLYQIADGRIQKIDPETRSIVSSIPAPAGTGTSGLAWAEGTLWAADYRGRKIHEIDPGSGAILRTIESNRFVTGVTWVDGELWHATWEDEASELRRVDPDNGEVLEHLTMPAGVRISGLESDGKDRFYCGGGNSGVVRAVRRPRKAG